MFSLKTRIDLLLFIQLIAVHWFLILVCCSFRVSKICMDVEDGLSYYEGHSLVLYRLFGQGSAKWIFSLSDLSNGFEDD